MHYQQIIIQILQQQICQWG